MKKVIVLSFLAVIMLLSCQNESKSGSADGPQDTEIDARFGELDTADMQSISLEDYNLNLSLKIPIVASPSGEIIEPVINHVDGDYLWYISVGEHFKLVIEDYAKEFNKVLSKQKELESQKNLFTVTYLIKEPHLLFYKLTLINNNGGMPSFHCFGEITIDQYNYVLRSETYGGYEQVIKDMVLSIRTACQISVGQG